MYLCHKTSYNIWPTPPACSCGGVRQLNFSREDLPGVSSTWSAEAPLSRETSKCPVCCLRCIDMCSWIGGMWYVGVFYIGGREGMCGVFRRLCLGMILGWDFYWFGVGKGCNVSLEWEILGACWCISLEWLRCRRCVCTLLVCICVEFAEICCCVTVSGCVSMLVVYLMLLNVVCFFSLGVIIIIKSF